MKRKNKSTLLVCINCMIITLAILLLPLAFFETSIYVKRSANKNTSRRARRSRPSRRSTKAR